MDKRERYASDGKRQGKRRISQRHERGVCCWYERGDLIGGGRAAWLPSVMAEKGMETAEENLWSREPTGRAAKRERRNCMINVVSA